MTDKTAILPGFVGRARELTLLAGELDSVRESGQGRFILVRGRRRVGKSWLVEEFLGRHGLSNVFFTAIRNAPDQDLPRFAEALAQSSLPVDARSPGVRFTHWEAALTAAALGATRDRPSVIVIDEFPYLGEAGDDQARAVESMFSAVWERRLSRLPIILIVVGSDLAMMERLTEYGRPLYDRPTRQIVVDPLTPRDVATIAGLEPAAAFDAYAVFGGLPAFASDWRRAGTLRTFLLEALAHPDSTFVNSAVRILDAEFPAKAQPRVVLSAIGHGERTSKTISSAAAIPASNLDRSLKLLSEKRVVRIEEPLSARRLRAPRYSIADPYLRFWLRFVEPALPEIERLRTEHVVERIVASWPDARGRAIEPIVRAALERLLPDDRLPGAVCVGSYWTRTNEPEIDLVGADTRAAPARVGFIGSIKWREREPFDAGGLEPLIAAGVQVPGVVPGTPLVAVSRTGFAPGITKLAVAYGPSELLAAYPGG